MTYSLDSQRKRKYFYRFVTIILLVDIGIVLIVGYNNQLDNAKFINLLIGLLGFTFIFYLLPLLILYYNYMNTNKDHVLIVKEDSKMIYTDEIQKKEFLISDVKSLEIHLSKTAFEKRMKWFFWDELFYYKINLKGGDTLIISCLMSEDLHKYFSGNQINKIKRLFPIVKTET